MLHFRFMLRFGFLLAIFVLLIPVIDCDRDLNEATIVKDGKEYAGYVVCSYTLSEYIVILPSFIPRESHEKYIEEVLGNHKDWKIIERHNEASEFPSDFILLKIENPLSKTQILSSLKKSNKIKHIYPQKRYTRSPNAFIDHDIIVQDFASNTGFKVNNTCTTAEEKSKISGR